MSRLGWYVIQAHPRKEPFVRDRIEEMGREVFLPVVREKASCNRRSRLAPLFPNYLFARLCDEEGDFPRVRWTPGVRRILGEHDRPRPLEDALVQRIRERSDRRGQVNLGLRLRRGARVRIIDGPLAGLVGMLERPASTPHERVCVLLDVFHRLTRVEVPSRAVWGAAGA